MALFMLSQATRTLVFIAALVLLGYSQANYAMDPPLDDSGTRRVSMLPHHLATDKKKGMDYFRQMLGQCIKRQNAAELKEFLRAATANEIDLKEELNRPSNSNLPFLYKALCDVKPSPALSEIITLLLENGADPNVKLTNMFTFEGKLLKRGYTAAHIAVITSQSEEVLGILAQFKTDFSRGDMLGGTPLKMAENPKTKPHVKMVIENILSGQPLTGIAVPKDTFNAVSSKSDF